MLLKLAGRIEAMLRWVAEGSGWLMVVLMVVICFDILSRKLGYQLPGMGSTRLQELEWHLHTVLFSAWLGWCYVLNAHPRVDTATAALPLRKRAWVELTGGLVFALPYAAIVAWFGLGFVGASYDTGESSEAVIGLPQRWIIKGLFVFGLWLLVAAILAVLLRLTAFLFGGASAAQAQLSIERTVDPL